MLATLGDDTAHALADLLPGEASVANPVDMLGGATAATYAEVVPRVLADPRVDAVIVLFAPTVAATAEEVAREVEAAAREAGTDKPVLAVIMAAEGIPEPLRALGRHVASFAYPESAARALGRAAERAEWLRAPQGELVDPEGIDREAARGVVERALAESILLSPSYTIRGGTTEVLRSVVAKKLRP